jgi:hypothetical protein
MRKARQILDPVATLVEHLWLSGSTVLFCTSTFVLGWLENAVKLRHWDRIFDCEGHYLVRQQHYLVPCCKEESLCDSKPKVKWTDWLLDISCFIRFSSKMNGMFNFLHVCLCTFA